jgi:HNH endonuclease
MHLIDWAFNRQPGDKHAPLDQVSDVELLAFLNSIRLIYLTQRQFTIVDAGDFEWLSERRWYASFSSTLRGFYVRGYKAGGGTTAMHRLIIGAKPGDIVDHINRDTLDNRRANLRVVTPAQSVWNRRLLISSNTSGFRGVTWHPSTKREGSDNSGRSNGQPRNVYFAKVGGSSL